MPIRWKFNLVVGLQVGVFLLTAGLAMRAVRGYTDYVRTHSRVRELADLTANIHIGAYRYLLVPGEGRRDAAPSGRSGWLAYAVHDIETQVRLAETDNERRLWRELQVDIEAMGNAPRIGADSRSIEQMAEQIDTGLGSLRRLYQQAQSDAIESLSAKSEFAQQAIWIAGGFIALLFFLFVILVRERLVKPVALLESAADSIGAGRFQGPIALDGTDELAQLARHIESMAERLADQQAALLKARELSAVGELCTSVAHGLRNPLAVIRNAANLEKYAGAKSKDMETMAGDIARQADRMGERITKLLEFSRPRELHREHVTFPQIALTARAHVRELFDQRGLTLTVEDGSENVTMQVDRDEMSHAIAELAINAAWHCPPGSEVVLRAIRCRASEAQSEGLRIEIIDPGAGMSPAEVKKAFDVFYTSRANGTGMGLAIVRRTVETHGGEVAIDSEVGKGTKVTIDLPATILGDAEPRTDGHDAA